MWREGQFNATENNAMADFKDWNWGDDWGGHGGGYEFRNLRYLCLSSTGVQATGLGRTNAETLGTNAPSKAFRTTGLGFFYGNTFFGAGEKFPKTAKFHATKSQFS